MFQHHHHLPLNPPLSLTPPSIPRDQTESNTTIVFTFEEGTTDEHGRTTVIIQVDGGSEFLSLTVL